MKRLWAVGLCALAHASVAEADAPSPPQRFENGVRGAFIGAGIGTTPVGDTMMAELGGESAGLRSYDGGRWLFGWDVRLAAKGGYLANQHPFLFLMGAHAVACVGDGYRFLPARHFSPYLGGHLGGDLQLMAHPGLAGSALDTINSVDSVGGVVAEGIVRIEAGVSLLDAKHSLLLVAFAQEALQAPQTNTPGLAFTQGGFGVRLDVAYRLTAELDAAWGVTPTRSDAARGLTDQTTRAGVSAAFRKIFGNGMWLGASVLLTRDGDEVVYAGGRSYGTDNAPTFGFSLTYGLPLWRRK